MCDVFGILCLISLCPSRLVKFYFYFMTVDWRVYKTHFRWHVIALLYHFKGLRLLTACELKDRTKGEVVFFFN